MKAKVPQLMDASYPHGTTIIVKKLKTQDPGPRTLKRLEGLKSTIWSAWIALHEATTTTCVSTSKTNFFNFGQAVAPATAFKCAGTCFVLSSALKPLQVPNIFALVPFLATHAYLLCFLPEKWTVVVLFLTMNACKKIIPKLRFDHD